MQTLLHDTHTKLKYLQDVYLQANINKLFQFNIFGVSNYIEIRDEKGVSNVRYAVSNGKAKLLELVLYTSDFQDPSRFYDNYWGKTEKDVALMAMIHEALHIAFRHVNIRAEQVHQSGLEYWEGKHQKVTTQLAAICEHIELTTAHKIIDPDLNDSFYKIPDQLIKIGVDNDKLIAIDNPTLMLSYLWENHREIWESQSGNDSDNNSGGSSDDNDDDDREIIIVEVDEEEFEELEGIEVKAPEGDVAGKLAGNSSYDSEAVSTAIVALRSRQLEKTINKRIHSVVRLAGNSKTVWTHSASVRASKIGYIEKKRVPVKVRILLDVSGSMVGGENSGKDIALRIIKGLPYKRKEVIPFNTKVLDTIRNWKESSEIPWNGGTRFECIEHLLDAKTIVITDGLGQLDFLTRAKVLVIINNEDSVNGPNVVHINSD